jgi:hypothetical protein
MLLTVLLACTSLRPASIPAHALWADDGQEIVLDAPLRLAVVGDVRPALPTDAAKGRVATPDTEGRLVDALASEVTRRSIDSVLLLGDLVKFSTTRTWRRFDRMWSPLLEGDTAVDPARTRLRALPVAGNHERYRDPLLMGFGAAFPGVGADVGYGRVAAWYRVDVVSRGTRWRLLVLDSDRKAMGTRWDAQLAWLDQALDGTYDHLVVAMHHPRWTLATGQTPDANGGPSALLDRITGHVRMGTLVAVFAGHAHTSEVFLPDGPLGEIYVTAGGGGSPVDGLARRGTPGTPGAALSLEPTFDAALEARAERWTDAGRMDAAALQRARGEGAWAGYAGLYDAAAMPIQGWWRVALDGPSMALDFHMLDPDGTFGTAWSARWTPRGGWHTGR